MCIQLDELFQDTLKHYFKFTWLVEYILRGKKVQIGCKTVLTNLYYL